MERCTGTVLTDSSMPELSTWPRFVSRVALKPELGAVEVDTSMSFIVFAQRVNSRPRRPFRTSASNPSSYSSPRSGLRPGLPGADVMRPDPDWLPSVTWVMDNVRAAEYGAGA